MSFGEFLLGLLFIWAMIYFFMILFYVLADLFKDKSLSGWGKAGWIIFLLVLPLLGLLIYLIARGKGMQERRLKEMTDARQQFDAYVREQAGAGGGSADEIAAAKRLLDDGTISQAEFDQLKAKALAS